MSRVTGGVSMVTPFGPVLSAALQPIKQWPECSGCQCYPECRRDCPDSQKCYESMPEYWTKVYRARRMAAEVRARKPDTFGARFLGGEYRPSGVPPLFTVDRDAYWSELNRRWQLPYSSVILGSRGHRA